MRETSGHRVEDQRIWFSHFHFPSHLFCFASESLVDGCVHIHIDSVHVQVPDIMWQTLYCQSLR